MTDISNTCISWCPAGMGVRSNDGDISLLAIENTEDSSSLPQLPENLTGVQYIYIPLETLLVRHFQFPLKHPRFLDKDILLEELADTAGIEPDEWWLSWQTNTVDDGISGLVFGLKKKNKEDMQNTSPWQGAPLLLVDGWQRLNHCLQDHSDAAVIDMDEEGVFFGVFKQGTWLGMRRLNADMSDKDVCTSIAQQTLWSLQSMGFDAETMPILGHITGDFSVGLTISEENIQADALSELAPRHVINLNLPEPRAKEALNLRHGSWAKRKTSANIQAWYRPALFAAAIVILWLGLTIADNYRLTSKIAAMDASIEQAFHRGLPEQPVIIDALAQLRQAAGGKGIASQSNVSQQLYVISQAFQDTPWEMQSLTIDKAGVSLAGKVSSLDTLNTIKEKLSKFSGQSVRIADTDLKGNEVAFKVRW